MKIKIKVSMMFLAAIISLSACGKGNTEDAFKEVKQERQKLSSSDTAKESKTNKANKDIEVSIKASRENIKLAKDDEEKKISGNKSNLKSGLGSKGGVAKGSSCRNKDGVTEISKTVESTIQQYLYSTYHCLINNDVHPKNSIQVSSYSSAKTVRSLYTANDSDANYETKTETVDEEKNEPKPVYITKEIPEQGHWEKVVVKEAWTEEVPVYEQQYRMLSNDEDYTGLDPEEISDREEAKNGKGSWRGVDIDVQVGTEKIYHEAETEEKWVIDVPAHIEEVLDHYE